MSVLQVNDARLEPTNGLLHWQHAHRLPLGLDGVLPCNLSCSCRLLYQFPSCCWPQLRPAIPAPGHVPRLLLPAITPTSSCCWAGHVLPPLMIDRRLGLHPVSTPSATPQLSGELPGFPSRFSTCFVYRATPFPCSTFVRCGF
jgi:hypothetical protein